jgi:hypothetical protein
MIAIGAYVGGYFMLGEYLLYSGYDVHLRANIDIHSRKFPARAIRKGYYPMAWLESRCAHRFVSLWSPATIPDSDDFYP